MNKGWLAYNSNFRNNQKFIEYMEWFCEMAHRSALLLTCKRNDEIIISLEDGQRFLDVEELPEFVIFFDKDIRLARSLEQMGVKVFNTSRAIEVCDDKTLTHEILSSHGVSMPATIPCPKTFRKYTSGDLMFLEKIISEFSFPMVLKESFGSFGNEVYLMHTQKELVEKVIDISPRPMLFQEYIEESKGTHHRLYVVGGVYKGAVLVSNAHDWRSNVTGGEMFLCQPTREEITIAEKACQVLGLDFGGVDILLSKRGALVCEVNSNSFVKSFFEKTGINVARIFCEYVSKRIGEKC